MLAHAWSSRELAVVISSLKRSEHYILYRLLSRVCHSICGMMAPATRGGGLGRTSDLGGNMAQRTGSDDVHEEGPPESRTAYVMNRIKAELASGAIVPGEMIKQTVLARRYARRRRARARRGEQRPGRLLRAGSGRPGDRDGREHRLLLIDAVPPQRPQHDGPRSSGLRGAVLSRSDPQRRLHTA